MRARHKAAFAIAIVVMALAIISLLDKTFPAQILFAIAAGAFGAFVLIFVDAYGYNRWKFSVSTLLAATTFLALSMTAVYWLIRVVEASVK